MTRDYVLASESNEDGSNQTYFLMVYDRGRPLNITFSASSLENLTLEVRANRSLPLEPPTPGFTTTAAIRAFNGRVREPVSRGEVLEFKRLMTEQKKT